MKAQEDSNTKETTMKTRTCLRCKGKGFRNTPVVHLGVPGLCFGCDGSGTQGWVTRDELNGKRDAQWARHFESLAQEAADAKTVLEFLELFAHLGDGSKVGERGVRRRRRGLNKVLDALRVRWKRSKESQRDEKPARSGAWQPAVRNKK